MNRTGHGGRKGLVSAVVTASRSRKGLAGQMGAVCTAQGALSGPRQSYLWGAPMGGTVARMWEGRREVLHSAGGGGNWKTDFKSQSQLGAG